MADQVGDQVGAPAPARGTLDQDEQQLADLGYRQELKRAWSGFTNFAISFTIISVLAGTWTTFSLAWNNGGPINISWGWPIICALVLLVAVSMAELTSAFPTAGGPYWWAAKLGGAGWSWMTGWFNIVGLVGIVASVGYGAATFLNITLGVYGADIFGINFADTDSFLAEQFGLFVLILILYTLVNVFGDQLLALLNNISVGWHVLGVAVIIGLLVFLPNDHQSADFVFTEKLNQVGFGDGSLTSLAFWFLVVPQGFLLTMYTQTGYDASAHTAEETRGAAIAAAQGVWRSVFWSAVIGWFVLLALLFAASDVAAINDAGGTSNSIVTTALSGDLWAAKADPDHRHRRSAVLRRGRPDQRLADLVRVLARSRDARLVAVQAVGPRPGARLRRDRGIGGVADHLDSGTVEHRCGADLPMGVLRHHGDLHGRPLHRIHDPDLSAVPRQGDDFEPGPWTLGPALSLDQPRRDRLGDPRGHHLLPAVRPGERAVVRRVRRTRVQLHAAGAGARRARRRSGGPCPRRTGTPGPCGRSKRTRSQETDRDRVSDPPRRPRRNRRDALARRPAQGGRRTARSTRSSPPSPTCRDACSASASRRSTSSPTSSSTASRAATTCSRSTWRWIPSRATRWPTGKGGYGDFAIVPDMATLRRIPWLDRTALVLCDVANHDGSPVVASPRQVLIAQYERAARDGLHADAAPPSSSSTSTRRATPRRTRRTIGTSRRRSPTSSTTTSSPRPWTSSTSAPIRRGMHAAGIPVEFSKGEAWYGQHEVNTRYADAVTSADRHTIFKNGVKEIAFLNGISATFMAKPSEKDIGSSCHIHSSLVDAKAARASSSTARRRRTSSATTSAACAPGSGSSRCSSPRSINSYKRYATESWAPTSISWGRDNRTCGFRVVGHGASRRVECRIPGADVNPYLGYAALLAAGLDGIEKPDRPGARAEGQRLRRGGGGAVPLDAARGGRPVGGQQVRPQDLRRRQSGATTSTTGRPSSGCSTRS